MVCTAVEERAGARYRRRSLNKSLFALAMAVLLAAAIALDVAVGPGAFSPATVISALIAPEEVVVEAGGEE